MKQAVRRAFDRVKNFLSDKRNWLRIAVLIALLSAVIVAFVRELKSKKEKEVSNENS